MTTSYSVTRNDIINAALRTIGVLGLNQVATNEDFFYATTALNLFLKNLQARGATLWKIKEVVVQLQDGYNTYPIGPTAGYVASIPVTAGGSGYDGTSTITLSAPGTFSGYTNTTATASLVISSGAVTSVTITNAGTGYQSAPTITPGGAGTGATFGTPVIVGETVERPLRVLDQGNFIRVISTDEDTPISMLGRGDYEIYGSKTTEGIVNSFFYDPQLTNGSLKVYPTPGDATRELHLFVQSTIEDITNSTDTFDFPQEWFMALRYGLARELLVEYGVDEATERRIEMRWREYSDMLFAFSVDEASTYFTYDTRGM
jgi:hypothetical protein